MSNKLYIGNLSYNTTEGGLRSVFEQHGNVLEVVIIQDRETGRSRGFGFVTMETPKEAEAALALNDYTLDGRKLRVNIAQDKREGGGGGRGGRGGRGGFGGGGHGGGYGGGRGGYGGGRDRGDLG